MNLEKLKGFVYDKESGEIGAVTAIDLLEDTVSLMKDNAEIITTSIENIVFLDVIGEFDGQPLLNHDVLELGDEGRLFEIELVEDGKIQLFLLDDNLERKLAGKKVDKSLLPALETQMELVGSIYQLKNALEEEQGVNFNITIVRTSKDGEIKYYYVGNSKEDQTVDLIKVVYMGHTLIKEEDYERYTMSHDEFLEAIEDGTYVEVSPDELRNYVLGVTYGYKKEFECDGSCEVCDCGLKEEDEYDLEDEFEEESCPECGKYEEDCVCDW